MAGQGESRSEPSFNPLDSLSYWAAGLERVGRGWGDWQTDRLRRSGLTDTGWAACVTLKSCVSIEWQVFEMAGREWVVQLDSGRRGRSTGLAVCGAGRSGRGIRTRTRRANGLSSERRGLIHFYLRLSVDKPLALRVRVVVTGGPSERGSVCQFVDICRERANMLTATPPES
jgi:hypothetical protein